MLPGSRGRRELMRVHASPLIWRTPARTASAKHLKATLVLTLARLGLDCVL